MDYAVVISWTVYVGERSEDSRERGERRSDPQSTLVSSSTTVSDLSPQPC